jgi:hypothetical protein
VLALRHLAPGRPHAAALPKEVRAPTDGVGREMKAGARLSLREHGTITAAPEGNSFDLGQTTPRLRLCSRRVAIR